MRTMITGVAFVLASTSLGAQQPPAIRPLGKIERVSTDSLASAAAALPMPGGHVLVNDITSRRVLLFDSALAHSRVIADTTSASGNAYGRQAGTLIRYRGDTALFIDPSSLSMLVLGPTGTIVRVMAIPRANDAQYLIGSVFGTPGFDARGRLAYFGSGGLRGTFIMCCVGTSRRGDFVMMGGDPRSEASSQRVPKPDSAFVVRVDLESRVLDTAVAFRIHNDKQSVNYDAQGFTRSIENTPNPLPIVDVWTMLPDGSMAVVRGRDYHVDWLDAAGHWTSSPKMPFDWQHVDDERKLALIDSAVKVEQAAADQYNGRRPDPPSGAAGNAGGSGGRGSGGTGRGAGGGRGGGQPIPLVVGRAEPGDLPDYFPPFTEGALYPDAEGNLWIRTSTRLRGQPVYDIVNRKGELFDRVQLPPFRTIAGFGAGVVYMAVKDSAGVVHLERARVR
jgi:hypothetical protein